jgi:hypothetical protein
MFFAAREREFSGYSRGQRAGELPRGSLILPEFYTDISCPLHSRINMTDENGNINDDEEHRRIKYGLFRCTYDAGRTGAVSLWNGDNGKGTLADLRRKTGTDSGAAYVQSAESSAPGSGRDGGDSVVLCHDGDGGGICQFRDYEADAGSGNYHGGEHRHDHHLVDLKPVRY